MTFERKYDESYERVLQTVIDGRDFFESFYENFLASSAEVRDKFRNTDMRVQKGMLKRSFYSLLVFYASNQTDDYIVHIGESHNRHHLNIRPALYDLWLDCLIATLAVYDPEFSDEVELSWRLVMAPGITYMKFKYDH